LKIVAFIVVCEGELEMAKDAAQSLVTTLAEHETSAWVLDDGSRSSVGVALTEYLRSELGINAECLRLPASLGFRGSAQRAFIGLEKISHLERQPDVVVKIDADALVVRPDLGQLVARVCPDGIGLYGEAKPMRYRDRVLYLADQLPLGFSRELKDGIIQRKWALNRTRPVWWNDLALRALLHGFRFKFIPGCFWFLGGKTLSALRDSGTLVRSQSASGFVFNDDIILTTATYALGHRVVDLADESPHWQRTMSMSETTPLSEILRVKPYVVHPLKNNDAAWARRRELRELAPRLL
jgi:hypothetical protein